MSDSAAGSWGQLAWVGTGPYLVPLLVLPVSGDRPRSHQAAYNVCAQRQIRRPAGPTCNSYCGLHASKTLLNYLENLIHSAGVQAKRD